MILDYKPPIQKMRFTVGNNSFFIMRDDLIPFSFGGNKVRIAQQYFSDLDEKGCDCMVTFGSDTSNLCRVIANMSAAKGIPCYIIMPISDIQERPLSSNYKLINALGAIVIRCLDNAISDTVEKTLAMCAMDGFKPYYTHGDKFGKTNKKTPIQAYVNAYEEIISFEQKSNINFDYIFHASGTGMTQAGLICGSILHNDNRNIIGVSIARCYEAGKKAIAEYVNCYYSKRLVSTKSTRITFIDDYVLGGYSKYNDDVIKIIQRVLMSDGIALDPIYTGKAFCGMEQYCIERNIKNKNILFIHTGGAPLFFDYVDSLANE
ncbi:MAG: 1-aminocyclopropane-1-carboxylate deaminase/D-cysteine desulfhydrase [Eubacteriales bacterium]